MLIDEQLLEIWDASSCDQGYRPLIDYDGWRVALLHYIEHLRPENLHAMQRHDETDEVFVLLAGRCILFLGADHDEITDIHALDLEPLKLYNVKRSCWHTHALSEDAAVLIIENRDTGPDNSPERTLAPQQRTQIVEMARHLWNGGFSQ